MKSAYKLKVVPQLKEVPVRQMSEQAALSLMIQDPDILAKQNWDASYFAIEAHRIVFNAIKSTYSRTGGIDEFMVIADLEKDMMIEKAGGEDEVLRIFSSIKIQPGKVCQDAANDYRRELKKAEGYRSLIKTWEEHESGLRRGIADLDILSESIARIKSDDSKPKRTKKEMLNQIIDEMEGKAKKECYSTGLIMLDRYLSGGMHRGEMMTVAAETGGGKSIILIQAIAANLLEGKSAIFFSLEMSGEDIYRRLAANIAGIPVREMEEYQYKYGRELPIISQTILKLINMPIEVIDNMHDISNIESEIARAANENRADIIAVDYLQIINMPNNDNRENAISEAARRLKTSASKNKIVLMTASQVNDDGKLRESRAIGMHSDQVIQVEHGKEKSRIVIKKNRRGARNATIEVKMNGEISKFTEV